MDPARNKYFSGLALMVTAAIFMFLITIPVYSDTDPSSEDKVTQAANLKSSTDEIVQKSHALGDGHKMPFGKGKPSTHVKVVDKVMLGSEFFSTIVGDHEAVLFRGIYKDSPPVKMWTDDYFLKLKDIPADHSVTVEGRKKENRSTPSVAMRFQEFVQIYNITDQYMVEGVPGFLWPDVQIPSPLQCDQLLQVALVEAFMWYSSGGTKSVVHTDSVENLNCLVAGTKRFVFVPSQYKELVLLDHPEGAYSGIDVEAVDYDKYPGLAQVEFMHADMQPGDCLYIPYKWIHQVESFNRNIAINFWWDTSKNTLIRSGECNNEFDSELTLMDSAPSGFSSIDSSPSVIRDQIQDVVNNGPADVKKFYKQIGFVMMNDEDFQQTDAYLIIRSHVKKIFELLDNNKDGYVAKNDLTQLDSDVWIDVASNFEKAGAVLEAFERLVEEGEDESAGHDEL